MKRVLTAAIGVPLVLVTTLFAPDWLFSLIVGAFAALAAEEFLSLAASRGAKRPGKWFSVVVGLVTVSFLGGQDWALTVLVLSGLILLGTTTFSSSSDAVFGKVTAGLAAAFYCGLMLGFLILLSRDMVLVLLAIVWCGDSAAYYGGKAFGRHLLAPTISPKKTVEGAISGLVTSIAAGTLMGMWRLGAPVPELILMSAVTGAAGQIGDLAESALKRSAGVKDSSSILPGHGGILDRLDSLFFAAPVLYWFFNA